MAGHSKWANIKHRKAGKDAAKSKTFTRIIKELTVAARVGGGDTGSNPRLSLAISQAKAANMPKDNIERAIKKGTGELDDGSVIEEVTYEGYGPGGIAYFVEATTDNINRTVGEVRHIFSKYGGNLGQNGSVAFLFEQKGVVTLKKEDIDVDSLMMEALEAGAEDVKDDDAEFLEIHTLREDLFTVNDALTEAGYTIESAELQRIPTTQTKVDASAALSNFKLMDKLEENDDVTQVFNNLEMDEETVKIAENM